MDNINSSENNTASEDAVSQKDAKKRVTWVSRDHKSMVEFVSAIYKNLGHTDYHSNKAIATVHGLSPDSIKQQLASCQQYKLLEIKFGTGYKVTDLFKKIILPLNDIEKRNSIIESLKSPETYSGLFKQYEFHIVPPINGIKNHFVRNSHMKEDIAERAAQIFIDNLNEYNLLDARGVLVSGMPAISKDDGNKDLSKDKPASGGQETPPPPPPPPPADDLFELPIPLPNRRKAYLRYPLENLTRKDINVITKALEFIASSLDEE